MIEMTIDSIRVSLMNYQRVVILKEKASDRSAYLDWPGGGGCHRGKAAGGGGPPAADP